MSRKRVATKELIRQRDILKAKLDKLDYRIQSRKDRVMSSFVTSNLATGMNPVELKQFAEHLKYIAKTLANGEETCVDNFMLNNAQTDCGLSHESFDIVLDRAVQNGYLEKTVWAYNSSSYNGQYKQVDLQRFLDMCEKVELGVEFPYNMVSGEELSADSDWKNDEYQFIWLPTVKYKQLIESAYQAFLEDTKDDE